MLDDAIRQQLRSPYAGSPTGSLLPPVGPTGPADYSQPSVMNPFGRLIPSLFGPLFQEQARQQAFARNPNTRFPPEQVRAAIANAIGWSGVTKEEREAWEAENAAYRAERNPERAAYPYGYTPGTRVQVRSTMTRAGLPVNSLADLDHEGTVVMPGTPEAGRPGYSQEWYKGQRPHAGLTWKGKEIGGTPIRPEDSVAVRPAGSKYWYWRHPAQLEVLPPDEFAPGTEVRFKTNFGKGVGASGTVITPKAEHVEFPNDKVADNPDYVLVHVRDQRGPAYDAWFKRDDLLKKGKK